MESKKLTTEELQKLQTIQQKQAAIVDEFGQISLTKINLESREENAHAFLKELRQEEKDIAKEFEDKYGVGTINLEKGEFTPTETPSQPTETETKTVAE